MLKREIKYENPFTNEEVTEEHWFHISKADLVEMEMEEHNQTYKKGGETLTGMRAKLERITDSQDGKAIMAEFKDIIRRSYGQRDGDRFRKSQEISADFMASEAFSQLLFELCTNADSAASFVGGIVPNNLEQIAAEVRKEAEKLELEAQGDKDAPAIAAVSAAAQKLGADDPTVDPTGITGDTKSPLVAKVLTTDEMQAMPAEELQAGLASGRYKLS